MGAHTIRHAAVLTGLLVIGLGVQGLAPATATTGQDTPDGEQTVTGRVATLVRETPGKRPEPVQQRDRVLVTDDGVLPLTADSEVPDSGRVTVEVEPAGDEVRVTELVARHAETRTGAKAGARTTLRSGSAAAFTGTRSVYVAIVSPAGTSVAANRNTEASVGALVGRASSYWSSQTRGQVSFAVDRTLPKYQSVFGCDDPEGLWDEALDRFGDDADGAPVALGPGKHVLIVLPTDPQGLRGCPYGLGTMGSLGEGDNVVLLSDANQSLYAHELGHNLGLDHSNALRCSRVQDGSWTGSSFGSACRSLDYDDLFDVMGFSGETYGEGNLNAAHLDDMGLQSDVITSITTHTTRTVKIAPLSSASTAPRGVRVVDAKGRPYFVEYRTDTGRDRMARTNANRPQLGVRVLQESPGSYGEHGSHVLDATPSSATWDYRRAIPASGVFRTASRLTTVQVLRQDASGATLRIVNTPTALAPTRAAMSAPSRVRKRTHATFATRVRDRAGTYAPYQKVQLQRRNARKRWVAVRNLTTSTTGYARTTYRMTAAGRFRWVVPGTRAVSPQKVVSVRR